MPLPALPAGKVDLVISGMNPTEERAKVVDFSEIYYNSQHGILVRAEDVDKYKTFADLEGVKVGEPYSSFLMLVSYAVKSEPPLARKYFSLLEEEDSEEYEDKFSRE